MHTSAACRNRKSRSPGVPVPPSPASSPAFSRSSSAATCSSMLLPAEQRALAGRQKQHVPVPKHGLGAVLVEDGPAVHLGRDPKRDAAGKIRLDEAGDDVH